MLLLALAACGTRTADQQAPQNPPSTWFNAAERAEAVVECLREHGVGADIENSIGVRLTGDDGGAYETCSRNVDTLMPPPPIMDDDESYTAWAKAAECIRKLGFPVPPTPSFEVWVDEKGANWNPYDDLGEAFWEVHARCPQPGLGLTATTNGSR